MSVRLYVVTDAAAATTYLVVAKNRLAAKNYIAHTVLMTLSAKPASPGEVLVALAGGKPARGNVDDLVAIGLLPLP